MILDIPEGFRNIMEYRASLGHKVNHQYRKTISEGEELTVNYYQDYKGEDSPGYALKQMLKVLNLKLDWDQKAIIEEYSKHLQDFVESKNMKENLTEAIIEGIVKHKEDGRGKSKDVIDMISLLKRLEKNK